MNKQKLENPIEPKVSKMVKGLSRLEKFSEDMERDYGYLEMTEKTKNRFFEGEEILMCKKCNTDNVYELKYDGLHNRSLYLCDNCNNFYIKKWKKSNEKY